MCMKIRVERDANSLLLPSDLENFYVGGAAHVDFANMNDVPPGSVEN